MADEVPVSDILCEAMEYLTKLGSNLRSRSESLKEKKIRRDKLKNSHAVQKAAHKVLLICELSKKSLENVETGVKRVLSLVDAAQQSTGDGGKRSSDKQSGTGIKNPREILSKPRSSTYSEKNATKILSSPRKIHVSGKSYCLRFPRKISVKHFMSVKVLTRSMPKSMIDKYPVYYGCKLYYERQKATKKSRESTSSSDEITGNLVTDDGVEDSSDKNHCKDDTELNDKDSNSETKKQPKTKRISVDSESNSGGKSDGSESQNHKSSKNKRKHEQCNEINKDHSESDSCMEKGQTKLTNISDTKESRDPENEMNLCRNELNQKSDSIASNSKENEIDTTDKHKLKAINTEKKNEEKSGKKFRKIKMLDDSSDSEKEKDEKVDKKPVKKFKKIKMVDDSSDTDKESTNKNNDSIIDLDGSEDEKDAISVENDKGNVNSDTDSKGNDKKQINDEKKSHDENSSVLTKPLIKCVSISKLLKPDVVDKPITCKEIPAVNPSNLVVHMTAQGEIKSKYLNTNTKNVIQSVKNASELFSVIPSSKQPKKKVRYQDEEDFWENKRKEVKAFKPINFVINISRLPKFEDSFMQKHNINKITQYGNVLYEISIPDHSNLKISKNAVDFINKEKDKSAKDAKDALLNDSDAEVHEASPTTPSLACDPENNKNLVSDDSQSYGNNVKKKKTNDLTEKSNISNETQKVKSTLLNDSDSDIDKQTQVADINGKSQKGRIPDNTVKNNSQNNEEANNSKEAPDDTNNIKKSLLEDSESDKNDEKDTSTNKSHDKNVNSVDQQENNTDRMSIMENQNKDKSVLPNDEQDKQLAKSSLLNESSDSSAKSQSRKRKRKDSTTKSPRKHIMESMHAKKMLLTYSSSSDTEDEQLKSVIKDIKDELMKNIEEKEDVTKCLKKKTQSSDSEEDILQRLKKNKKQKNENADNQSEKANTTDKAVDKADASEAEHSSPENSKSRSAKMGRSIEKSGDSSSQNCDSPDDKDIEGLTNLKSLTKHRRRRGSGSGSGSEQCARRSTRKSKRMAKASQIFDEGLLAPESSDDGSAGDSDGPDEDLPPVTMPGLNGDGIEHLAKDDLLGESESDTSKEISSDAKKEDESDSETMKSKRRKAQAISSDSEAGSSRRKQNAERISDFEDSEEESSEPVKRGKRKKKDSDSDASHDSSLDGKKKRKRIKQLDSDEGSGSDTENEGRNKHGRKNIRKVMGKNQLEEATKKAAREEKERLARIAERQKLYNNLLFDETGKPDEVIVDKVVLDFDPETKEPLIEVDRGLVKKLKPHQANGIKFMWDACFESVKRIKKDKGSGCILAHCMGLGKTLQVVSLTHTLLTHGELTGVERVLVVCPLSTVLNWVHEFRMWLKHAAAARDLDIYELSKYKQNSERAFQLSQWLAHGGVCVLGYEMFRNLSADNPKKFKKKMLRQFQESLVDPGPDLVVCDEGHLLKNEKTSLSQSMNRVRTRRRIVLTGTPLQNNLKEYYCMVQFVKPNLLGKYNEYLNRFVNPITNGQYTDSTEHDIRVMKRRSHVLHKMLDGAVQRRDYGVLAPFLPPKHEYVLFITLTEVQIKLYQHYLDNYSRRPLPGKSSGFLFPDFQSLQRIWTHPLVLKYNSERYEIMQQKKREREEEDSEGSLVDFIDDDSTPDESSTEESSSELSDASDDSRKKSKKKKGSKKSKTKDKDSKLSTRRGTRANPVEVDEEEIPADPDIVEVKNDNPTEWWIPLVTDDEIEDMRNSHKLVLLFEILRQCEAIGDKLLVFSQSLYSLDLIEHFLGKVDEATQEGRIDEKLGGHVGSWSPGIDYFRLDGSTSCENRSIWCKNFNREDNPRARLFLISTRAGGLGINLVAANRVVIFDVSWNPSHDVQSIFRVYRFGQKKPCYIYRFLAMGTMEEKIYERQVTKQAISKRVIDEQQIDRHYAENDLAELYKFEPRPPAPRPVPLVPKDRLFAEMLKEHEPVIYKFHEHDSLLENKEEETLSEEERRAAWEDFENEKNRPPPPPLAAWPHNGLPHMGIMAQQQQLAYAALAGMLRKDMPALSDDNIRAMLPLLYSSNPQMFGGYDYGLMQKLSEMYKYAQPGMMNPQMMNMNNMNMNNMNAGGVGGSSGLQYEPPWQRQQQQQQQMRLQQLLQHQNVANPMGAKFYAGGLGSRDPVAMALQQQRAREIMVAGGGGGGAGARGRGRPPLQPRAPPPATDVVDLDSD